MQYLKEYLSELRNTNNSLLAGKLNDISKTFTITIFLTMPLTLFATIIAIPQIHDKFLGGPNDFFIIMSISSFLLILSIAFSK
jgi:Mg2+ and Co2+ transporter CorA